VIHPDGAASARRALAAVAAVLVALGPAAETGRADGDPASDVLLEQNVYFPYRAPSPAARAALERIADAVYARGDRVKVALIYTAEDLGAIPSLFGQPGEYAHFLGVELGLWYVGPLLVVMPAGFGVYDGGRSTTATEQVLRSVDPAGGRPDDLVRSATIAVQRLAATGALRSPDVTAPLVNAHPAVAARGKVATLHFDLFDDSGRSGASVRIYDERSLLATLTAPRAFRIGTRAAAVRWAVPARLRSRRLRFCVVASDPAENRSRPACASFLRVR
jgi:hypothetical protein